LYFLLKYVLPPVLFTLTQVVLLLITSTFTRVQIQSNLGTTDPRSTKSSKQLPSALLTGGGCVGVGGAKNVKWDQSFLFTLPPTKTYRSWPFLGRPTASLFLKMEIFFLDSCLHQQKFYLLKL
jgi:hypothetical protein